MKIEYDMEFINLKQFLELPFLNPYSKCTVIDMDNEINYIDVITMKDLLIELNDGMYELIVENYFVENLMPRLVKGKDGLWESMYTIYLKRY